MLIILTWLLTVPMCLHGDQLLFEPHAIEIDEKGYLYLNIVPKPSNSTQITGIDDYIRMDVNRDDVKLKNGAEEIFEHLSSSLDVPQKFLHLYLYYPSGRKTILLSQPTMTVPEAFEKLKHSIVN